MEKKCNSVSPDCRGENLFSFFLGRIFSMLAYVIIFIAVMTGCIAYADDSSTEIDSGKIITLQKQDLYDILYGCTILGTGGGGSLKEGLAKIDSALAQGKTFKMVKFSEVPDDAWIAVPYRCGSISPDTPELKKKYAGLPHLDKPMPYLAYQALEKYVGKSFFGVMPTELGGNNTAEAMYIAALLDKYIIDADPAGRAVPELQHSTFYIKNIPIYPLSCANQFGDVAILTHVVDDFRAEALVRAMAVASKNTIGVTDHPAQAKTLRNAVIEDSISYAWRIGKSFREAKESKEIVARAIADAGKGFLLFEGRVIRSQYKTVEGFTVGDVYVKGEGKYADNEYRVWFKNENIISWLNGKVDVTAPDLIIIINEDKREPNLNPYFTEGMKVSVIGLPSPAIWRTERGLEVFGPKHFGFDIDYVPLEKKSR